MSWPLSDSKLQKSLPNAGSLFCLPASFIIDCLFIILKYPVAFPPAVSLIITEKWISCGSIMRKNLHCGTFLILLSLIIVPELFGRALFNLENNLNSTAKSTANEVYVTVGVHNIGKIGLTVSNNGHFGTGFFAGAINPEDGGPAPSCIYPYPGRPNYLFAGAFWIGAVVGRDTLVSVGADGWHDVRELWPDPLPDGDIIRRSISNPDDELAVSEQDFIATYTDTVTRVTLVSNDPTDNRPHVPLGIEITQRSYAWSYAYAEDFVLFDYSIKNIGRNMLEKVYMGIYVDADVSLTGGTGYDDDICGFKRDIPSSNGCGFIDTVNMAWIADNDGKEQVGDNCPYTVNGSLTSATATRIIRTPSDSLKYSFNWWISNSDAASDFGPRRAGTTDDPFYNFGGYLGTPEGDKNKYYIMRHEEFDYDQLFCAVDHTSDGWLPIPSDASNFADGYDTRYLLSFGPFDISPGEVLPISFAYIAGADFHRPNDCGSFTELFDAAHPEVYYNTLDFEDLGVNSVWASWIYDNPGVDTDGDGYSGKFRICIYDADTVVVDTLGYPNPPETTIVYNKADTFYYEGDGIPDFRGAAPPAAPILRVLPRVTEFNEGELIIQWNGFRSEEEKDKFSNLYDFEGYRVYQSLTNRRSDFVLVASYDLNDYVKYIWNSGRNIYVINDPPFTIDSLQILYGANFNPLNYPQEYPFEWQDSTFYFKSKEWNVSELTDSNLIHKIYPAEPPPHTLNFDSARIYYPEELTAAGDFKYYEYEYVIRRLLTSQLYYVSVTAFDFGSPKTRIEALESSPLVNMVAEYAQNQNSVVESAGLDVVVYPNPYRIDANYRRNSSGGFEGRGAEDKPDDRVRRIHFTNLPNKCTIRIYTIDGDLVREIDHNMAYDDPRSMHDEWDLITRNTQAAVSGIYYYVVESDKRTQIGKLVIIM
jgi:hypothetical protein